MVLRCVSHACDTSGSLELEVFPDLAARALCLVRRSYVDGIAGCQVPPLVLMDWRSSTTHINHVVFLHIRREPPMEFGDPFSFVRMTRGG